MKYTALIFLSTICFSLHAQESSQLMSDLVKEDSAAITAIALYPESVRKDILVACANPEVLVRMEALQKNTSQAFRKLIEGYSKEVQQKVWDISRYDGLIAALIREDKMSKSELEKRVLVFPEEIRESAVDFALSHYELLVKINALNVNSVKAFESAIVEYPEQVRNSFQRLVKYPELVSILTEDMKMSVLVGTIYKKQPQLIEYKLDSISTEHAKQNTKDLEEWKAGLERNPEAKKEMEEASREYAREQGYKDEELTVKNETVVVNYVVHPYPYWYGYPWWYDYPYWYPYPYWYDWGFYYGPYGIVYIGFPSPYFVHWYFYHPGHHYHYNHFSDYCVNYYYGPRRSVSGLHREVTHWIKSTEKNVPRNFFAPDAKRPDRIKELGKFEMEYEKAVMQNPGKTITRDEFIQANTNAYPNISPVLNEPRPKAEAPVRDEKQGKVPVYQEQPRPRPRPSVIIPGDAVPAKPVPQPRPKPSPSKLEKPIPQPPPKRKKNLPGTSETSAGENMPGDNLVKMNEAYYHHRSGWNGE